MTHNGETPAFDRRTVLKSAAAASAVGLGSVTFSGGALAEHGDTFAVEQGGECVDVTPLSTDETVEDFYNYISPHSHTTTDIERSDVSNLFLFEGPEGLSLVVLHDKANDGHTHGSDTGGGAATFVITGLPTGSGQWVVRDDGEIGPTDTSPDWSWATAHTDGGAWRGGLDCDFSITIDPAFNDAAEREPLNPGTIDEWHFLSGDASDPERTSLDLDAPVTIRCGTCVEVGNVEFKGCSEVWIAFDDFPVTSIDARVNVDGTPRTVTIHEDDLTRIPGQFGHDTPVFKYAVDEGEKILAVEIAGETYENDHRCAENAQNGGSEPV